MQYHFTIFHLWDQLFSSSSLLLVPFTHRSDAANARLIPTAWFWIHLHEYYQKLHMVVPCWSPLVQKKGKWRALQQVLRQSMAVVKISWFYYQRRRWPCQKLQGQVSQKCLAQPLSCLSLSIGLSACSTWAAPGFISSCWRIRSTSSLPSLLLTVTLRMPWEEFNIIGAVASCSIHELASMQQDKRDTPLKVFWELAMMPAWTWQITYLIYEPIAILAFLWGS